MNHNKEFTSLLAQTAEITRGRIHRREVYRDFIDYCALNISVQTDHVHQERKTSLDKLLKRYKEEERAAFAHTFRELAHTVVRNVEGGIYEDLLGSTYCEFGADNRALKQDFTPQDVARLLAKITTIGNHYELPSEGFFTLNDPTSGSGILLLAAVEEAIRNGLNPSEQFVIQASDCDIACAQMTYIHLSLYGIPAVVVQGDCISMKEYSRWYTPVYLWRKWVWRAPMSFGTRRNPSDEQLKMLTEPMYAQCRKLDQFFRKEVSQRGA